MLLDALQQLALGFGAVADQADRLAKQPKVTVELRVGGASFSADEIRRNSPQTEAVINELRRRGLVKG